MPTGITAGEEPYVPQELPDWSEARALHSLLVERMAFDHPSGNCQGFASGWHVSVRRRVSLISKVIGAPARKTYRADFRDWRRVVLPRSSCSNKTFLKRS